jgi:hypothetical protein
MIPESTLVDLGDHAVEITAERGILIASHPGSIEVPIREVVQLSAEETYKLLAALTALYSEGAQ